MGPPSYMNLQVLAGLHKNLHFILNKFDYMFFFLSLHPRNICGDWPPNGGWEILRDFPVWDLILRAVIWYFPFLCFILFFFPASPHGVCRALFVLSFFC